MTAQQEDNTVSILKSDLQAALHYRAVGENNDEYDSLAALRWPQAYLLAGTNPHATNESYLRHLETNYGSMSENDNYFGAGLDKEIADYRAATRQFKPTQGDRVDIPLSLLKEVLPGSAGGFNAEAATSIAIFHRSPEMLRLCFIADPKGVAEAKYEFSPTDKFPLLQEDGAVLSPEGKMTGSVLSLAKRALRVDAQRLRSGDRARECINIAEQGMREQNGPPAASRPLGPQEKQPQFRAEL